MSVENRIREIRLYKQLNQKDFGDFLGLTLSNVSQIERGKAKASVELISNIVEKFNISSNWLLTGEGEMFLPTEEEKKAVAKPSLGYLEEVLASKEDLEEVKQTKADKTELRWTDNRVNLLEQENAELKEELVTIKQDNAQLQEQLAESEKELDKRIVALEELAASFTNSNSKFA